MRKLKAVTFTVALLLICAELFARFYLGLGDPPLSIVDPQIEYLFKPSSTYKRFGNLIAFNAYSMRSRDFPAHKVDPTELRVMVMGDSVINGGAITDQSDLATTLLEHDLQEDLQRPVVVGNISAGSWGPGNLLAYAQRFGFFDADIVMIVLSSHDYGDAPSFQPIVGVDPGMPDKKPLLALQEVFTRYLPQYIATWRGKDSASLPEPIPSKEEIDSSLAALRNLLQLAQSTKAKVILVQHLKEDELDGHQGPGFAAIASVGREERVPIVQLGLTFAASLKNGINPYWPNPHHNEIHPNKVGQRLMANVFYEAIKTYGGAEP